MTASTAGLEYQCQSGALNESISDIMAWNLDPEDPTYGEDRNGDGPDDPDGGTIRDYRSPTRFDQPMHVDDYNASPTTASATGAGSTPTAASPTTPTTSWSAASGATRPSSSCGARSPSTWTPTPTSRTSGPPCSTPRGSCSEDGPEQQGVDEAFATVGLDGTWEAPDQEGC